MSESTDLGNLLTVPPDRLRVTVTYEHGDGRNTIAEVVLNDEGAVIEEALAVLRLLLPNRVAESLSGTLPKLRAAAPIGT